MVNKFALAAPFCHVFKHGSVLIFLNYIRNDEQYRGIPGYDFVVNSAWPQIVASLEKELPELFSSRDPNAFHMVSGYFYVFLTTV